MRKLSTIGIFVILLALTLCTIPAKAQDTTQGFTLGLSYNQEGSPQLAGWGTYDHQISGKLFSYSGYDVSPIKNSSGTVSQIQIVGFTGLAYEVAVIGKLSIWGEGAGGVSSSAATTTGAANFGGFLHYMLGKGWGLVLGGQGNYTPGAGTARMFRLGFRYGAK